MTFAAVIERLNIWGDQVIRIAWPVFWQSSILIVGMFALDVFLRRKLRPAVRYALWLVILVKLVLPPSFASPTGVSWWLRARETAPNKPSPVSYLVTYGPTQATVPIPAVKRVPAPAAAPHLSAAAWALLGTCFASLSLLVLMCVRWRRFHNQLRTGPAAPMWLQDIVNYQPRQRSTDEHADRGRSLRTSTGSALPLPQGEGWGEGVGSVRQSAVHGTMRHHRGVRLKLTTASISPALYGLFRPVIVLPAALIERLTPAQLRAVALHELIHLRNGDVWINCAQSLLQIVFWWHPLLWFANARIRRIREEVVDDAVRVALGEESESYAPTLLEVARLALTRPLATLGLVGILESRTALRQRIERMVNYPVPKRTGLTLASIIGVLAFSSVAVPMGQAPPKLAKPTMDNSAAGYYRFGSNAVEALSRTLRQFGGDANLWGTGGDLLAGFSAVQPPNFRGSVSNSEGGKIVVQADHAGPATIRLYRKEQFLVEQKVELSAGTNLFTFPQTESSPALYNYEVQMDAAGGAKLAFGDTAITADTITLNQESGELVAEGSVKVQLGDRNLESQKLTGNVTNLQLSLTGNPTYLQLAQAAPSTPYSSRAVFTSSGRKAILKKLEAIRLDNVSFDNLPLSEVVNYLRGEAKKRDPEGKGINFIINANVDMPAPAIDPSTGLPIPATPPEPVDINGVTIRIVPPLNDVRMIDVLDAVVKVASRRIGYSIEDYGISFRAGVAPGALFSRTIKVDPNTFAQGLESVGGVSIGNFQTGGQGGGQQGNGAGGVTFPRVQAAPNVGGGQGGQGGVQGGGGGISGVTRPTTAITPQAIRQFFVNAGVDLSSPKSIYFDQGASSLLVNATREDINKIENAIKALASGSAQPAATRSKTEENSNAAQTNAAKVPIFGGDTPILGKLFTRTVEVSSAALPAAQVSGVSQNPNAPLYTRTMKPDMNFFVGVQKRAGLTSNASQTEQEKAFLALLPDAGVRLSPSELVRFVDHGKLLVQATKANMDAIEAEVLMLSVPPPQVTIKAKFVEVPKGDAQYLLWRLNQLRLQDPTGNAPINQLSNADASFAEAMTDSQFRALLAEAKQRSGADLLSEASVTTLSGRQAQIQMVDMKTIVLKINPQAAVLPGVTSSNIYVTENLALGPVLDVTPVVAEDGLNISLNVTATVTGFVGYDASADSQKVQVFVDGRSETVKPPLPHIRTRQVQMAATITDGQTLLLHNPRDVTFSYDKDGNGTPEESTSKEDLLVFVTTTIIDSAGNPVHSSDAPNQK